MRLIDADEIVYDIYDDEGTMVVTADDIAKMPTVDAVEVVRCKECKHYQSRWQGFCELIGDENVTRTPDDYCSRGERRW